jgi:Fic family protein
LDPDTLGRLRQEWGIRQVHESAAIEGNQLTLNETQVAIQRGITISGKPPEHSAEVQNLHNALQYVETLARSSTPITEAEIRELQGIIVGRNTPGAGMYRSVEVQISGAPHKPPHPLQVPPMMQTFARWIADAEQTTPLPLLTAVCHAWLVHIHPFVDGNGRTARAVTNLLLIRQGYPIVVIRKKDRQRYYEALRESDEGDITGVLELIVDRCQDSIRQIDRVRTATTGLSLVLQRVREKEERQYRIWSDGLRLFGSTLESAMKEVEADPDFSVEAHYYDVPSIEDYRDICSGSPGGNTWFFRYKITRGKISRSFLLWIGFSSTDLTTMLSMEHPIPSVKISVPNDEPPPVWVLADKSFPSQAVEFAYENGRFYRLEGRTDPPRLRVYDSVVQLAAEFVAELVEGWFV